MENGLFLLSPNELRNDDDEDDDDDDDDDDIEEGFSSNLPSLCILHLREHLKRNWTWIDRFLR